MVNLSQLAGRADEEFPETRAGTIAQPIPASAMTFELASRAPRFWDWPIVLIWLWVGGAGLCTLVAATRIVRFEHLLKDTLPASKGVQHLTLEVAAKLGVRRTPTVRYFECVRFRSSGAPGDGQRLYCRSNCFSDSTTRDLRSSWLTSSPISGRDHWVRAVELFVSAFYWWNPLVWFIRRQLHEAEDLCCDAWVRSVFPECTKRYAEVLLETAESLSARQVRVRLLPASPFLRSLSLKARIEMILEQKFVPRLSRKSMAVIALFAILTIPSFVPITRAETGEGRENAESATAAVSSDTPATAEFPYSVRFEQGATRFLSGDGIIVTDVPARPKPLRRGISTGSKAPTHWPRMAAP